MSLNFLLSIQVAILRNAKYYFKELDFAKQTAASNLLNYLMVQSLPVRVTDDLVHSVCAFNLGYFSG